jgi:hypothetical protein
MRHERVGLAEGRGVMWSRTAAVAVAAGVGGEVIEAEFGGLGHVVAAEVDGYPCLITCEGRFSYTLEEDRSYDLDHENYSRECWRLGLCGASHFIPTSGAER